MDYIYVVTLIIRNIFVEQMRNVCSETRGDAILLQFIFFAFLIHIFLFQAWNHANATANNFRLMYIFMVFEQNCDITKYTKMIKIVIFQNTKRTDRRKFWKRVRPFRYTIDKIEKISRKKIPRGSEITDKSPVMIFLSMIWHWLHTATDLGFSFSRAWVPIRFLLH